MAIQCDYLVSNFFTLGARLKQEVWFEKNKILIQPHETDEKEIVFSIFDKDVDASAIHNEGQNAKNMVLEYLRSCSLVANHSSIIAGGIRGTPQNSLDKKYMLLGFHGSIDINDQEERKKLTELYPKFIDETKIMHEAILPILKCNEFLQLAMTYAFHGFEISRNHKAFLINSTMSLEAMFNEGPSDIAYKLAMRIAFLSGITGFDPIEVFDKVKKMYRLRNKVVHGSNTPSQNFRDISIYDIYKYATHCIKLMIILCKNRMEKNSKCKEIIIKEIDHAILDPEKANELSEELARGLKIFDISVLNQIQSTNIVPVP